MRSASPDWLPVAAEIARHRHAAAYATLVLEGGYEEAGDAGRHRVGAGDVLLHGAFSAHRDLTGRARTRLLDLPLPRDGRHWTARGHVTDPDAIVRLAERDSVEASAALLTMLEPAAAEEVEPADALAAELAVVTAIGGWAERRGHCRETLSRQFRRLYGIDAAAYRAEARARRAWRLITGTASSLADIAQASGHADQAHMTRAVRALTGATPGEWRRSVTSVQDRSATTA